MQYAGEKKEKEKEFPWGIFLMFLLEKTCWNGGKITYVVAVPHSKFNNRSVGPAESAEYSKSLTQYLVQLVSNIQWLYTTTTKNIYLLKVTDDFWES